MATAAPTSQFAGVDFLNLDTLLSEEERAVRDTVRAWVDEHLIPVIGEAYIEGRFPKQLIAGTLAIGAPFASNKPSVVGGKNCGMTTPAGYALNVTSVCSSGASVTSSAAAT